MTITPPEMGKTFKVHMDFDLDLITTEEHCGCSAPDNITLDKLNQEFRWMILTWPTIFH